MVDQDDIGRIILFRQGQFGDTLAAFPLIESLHENYPNTPLVYCTNRYRAKSVVMAEAVMQLSPHSIETASYCVEDTRVQKWRELKARLTPHKSDLLLYLPYSQVTKAQIWRDWAFFRTLGFTKLCGFRENHRWADALKSGVCTERESARLVRIAQECGLAVDERMPCTVCSDQHWLAHQWSHFNPRNLPVLALCPGSKMQSKRWPIEHYARVLGAFRKKADFVIALIGGPEEAGLADVLQAEFGEICTPFFGATLAQTAALLKSAHVYLGNDTGSMHLAAIMGIHCVAIFSAREKLILWSPAGSGHETIQQEIECSGCRRVTCFADPAPCLLRVTPRQVEEALEKVWFRRDLATAQEMVASKVL